MSLFTVVSKPRKKIDVEVEKHAAPVHPGTGSDQSVHGTGKPVEQSLPEVEAKHEAPYGSPKPSVWDSKTLSFDSGDAGDLREAKRKWFITQSSKEVWNEIDTALDHSADSHFFDRGPFAEAVGHVYSGKTPQTDLQKGVALQRSWTQKVWERIYGDATEIPVYRVEGGPQARKSTGLVSFSVPENRSQLKVMAQNTGGELVQDTVTKDEAVLLFWGEGRFRSNYVSVKGEVLAWRPEKIGKHADHDQSTHGNWARDFPPGTDWEKEYPPETWPDLFNVSSTWIERNKEYMPGRFDQFRFAVLGKDKRFKAILQDRSLGGGVKGTTPERADYLASILDKWGEPGTAYRGSRREGVGSEKVGDVIDWGDPVLSATTRKWIAAGFAGGQSKGETIYKIKSPKRLYVRHWVDENNAWEEEVLVRGGSFRVVDIKTEESDGNSKVPFRVVYLEPAVAKHATHDQTTHGNWSRGLSARQIATNIDEPDEGFTRHYPTGTEPTTGFAVALPGHEAKIEIERVTEGWVRQYRKTHAEALGREDTNWGGWVEPNDSGGFDAYLDVSVVTGTLEEAQQIGYESDQLAVYDIEAGETIYLEKHAQHNQKDHGNWARGTIHHPTATIQGRPACAGTGKKLSGGSCPNCGRTRLGTSSLDNIIAHLHPDDMATRPTSVTPVPPETKPKVKVTPAMDKAITDFHNNKNSETFAAMKAVIPEGFNYVQYAREKGLPL